MNLLARFVTSLAVICCFTNLSLSQWTKVNPPSLFSALVQSSGTLFVGLHGGGVYTSPDKGTTFSDSRNGLGSLEVTSMTATSAAAYASTANAGIFVSSDHGETWNAANNFLISNNVACIAAIGDTLFSGPVGFGAFFSSDGGQSWLPSGKGLGLQTITTFFRFQASVFAGTTTGVFRTIDGGKNWTGSGDGLPVNASVQAFCSVGGGLFAAIPEYGVYVSKDGGNSWASSNGGLTDLNVSCLTTVATAHHQRQNIIIGTATGGLFFSPDSGTSWVHAVATLSSDIVGAVVAVDTIAYAAMGEGLRVSSDGGGNWTTLGVGLPNSEVSGLAIAGGAIFIGIRHSGVFSSSNNGSSWTRVNENLSNNEVTAMAAQGSTIFVGTTGGEFFRRSLADSVWTIGGVELNGFAINAVAVAGTTVIAASGKRGVYYSLDNGLNWNNGLGSTPGINGTQVTSLAVAKGTAIGGSVGFGVLRSTDNGKNWVQSNAGLQNSTVVSVSAADSFCVAATATGISVSRDAGGNWITANAGLGSFPVSCLATNGNVAFAGTQGGGIFVSTNYGTRWHPTGLGGAPAATHLLITDGQDLYAAGSRGGLSRCSIDDLLATILTVPGTVPPPTGPALLQNFPNPFNPKTIVRYSIGGTRGHLPAGQPASGLAGQAGGLGTSDVRLVVYDVLGREVAVLVNDKRAAGTYEVQFDGARMASGVYFYRLAVGTYTATKAMVLEK